MKIQKFKEELRLDDVQALKSKLEEMRRDSFKLRINVATAHVKDYSMFKKNRRNIARILTCIKQKGVNK